MTRGRLTSPRFGIDENNRVVTSANVPKDSVGS